MWKDRVHFKPYGKDFLCRTKDTAEALQQAIEGRTQSVESLRTFQMKMRMKLQKSFEGKVSIPIQVYVFFLLLLTSPKGYPDYFPTYDDLSSELRATLDRIAVADNKTLDETLDPGTEKDFTEMLKKYYAKLHCFKSSDHQCYLFNRHAASVIMATSGNESIDLDAHSSFEGLLKEGSTAVDLFNVMVRLGLFSQTENLEVILHPRPLKLPEESLKWVDVRPMLLHL